MIKIKQCSRDHRIILVLITALNNGSSFDLQPKNSRIIYKPKYMKAQTVSTFFI